MKTGVAAVALLLIAMAGCHRNDKAEKLSALESAYQSGVFTKEEYEAKKAALLGPPAAPAAMAAQPAAPPPLVGQPGSAPVPAGAASRPAPTGQVDVSPPVASAPARSAEPPIAPPPLKAAEPPADTAPAHPGGPASSPAPNPVAGNEPEPAPATGCDDAEYKAGKEKGAQQRFYPAPVDAVKRAAKAALTNLDFAVHKNVGNQMEASKRRHIGALIGAGGERILLHFDRSQRGNQIGTLVTAETRKGLVGRMAQKSWTNAVLAQIACQLRAH